MAREVDRRVEDVAQLLEDTLVRLGLRRPVARFPDGHPQLLDLVGELGEDVLRRRVVEADRRRAPTRLARIRERRQRLGKLMERPLAALLLRLDLLPALAHAPRRPRLRVTEDVRMPADELRVDRARDGLEVAVALLLEEKREEVDLEEQVAELVEELRGVVGVRGVGDLVRLLDRVRHDRARRLLAVPGAVAAQAPGQLLEVEKRLREWHPEDVTGSRSLWSPGAPEARSRSRS